MINGRAYDWEQLFISFLTSGQMVELRGINYRVAREAEGQYAAGAEPRRYGRGNFTGEGDFTVTVEGYRALQEAAKAQGVATGDLTGLKPFPITIRYQSVDQDALEVVIPDAVVTEVSLGAQQNDKAVEARCNFRFFSPLAQK